MLLNVEKTKNPITTVNKEPWILFALFAVAILLTPFQNTGLGQTALRYLGASLAFLPLSLFCLFSFALKAISGKWGKAENGVIFFLVYSFVLALWGLVTVDTGSLGTDFLIRKTVTNNVLNVLVVYPTFAMPFATKGIRRAVFASLFIAITGYILVDVFSISAFTFPSFFKATRGVTTPSGFSLEQSTFAATVCVLSLVAGAIAKKGIVRLFFLALAVAFVTVLTASKGTTLCLVMAFGFAYLLSSGKSIAIKCAGLLFALMLGLFVSEQMTDRFNTDIEKSSSTSTRSVLILSSIPSVIQNPIGVGYTGYIPAIMTYIYPTAEWLKENILPNVKLTELEEYFKKEEKEALNIKAQLFEYLMVFGFPGLIALFYFHLTLYRKLAALPDSRRLPFLVLFWFVVASLMSYMPALGMYFYTLAYGVMLQGDRLCEADNDKKHKTKATSFNFIR